MTKRLPGKRTQITFLCSIADTASAIKVSGSKDGLRLTLDLPESEIDAYLPLLALRGYPLRLTIEIDATTPLVVPDSASVD